MKQELFRSELRRKGGRALPLDYIFYYLTIDDRPSEENKPDQEQKEEFNIEEHIFIEPDSIFLVFFFILYHIFAPFCFIARFLSVSLQRRARSDINSTQCIRPNEFGRQENVLASYANALY